MKPADHPPPPNHPPPPDHPTENQSCATEPEGRKRSRAVKSKWTMTTMRTMTKILPKRLTKNNKIWNNNGPMNGVCNPNLSTFYY